MCAHYMYAGSLRGRTRGERHRGRVKRERKSANEEDACVVSVVCRLEESEATEGRRKMRGGYGNAKHGNRVWGIL